MIPEVQSGASLYQTKMALEWTNLMSKGMFHLYLSFYSCAFKTKKFDFLLLKKSQVTESLQVFRFVPFTYDDPRIYNGPIVKGWPPTKDRFVPKYLNGKYIDSS